MSSPSRLLWRALGWGRLRFDFPRESSSYVMQGYYAEEPRCLCPAYHRKLRNAMASELQHNGVQSLVGISPDKILMGGSLKLLASPSGRQGSHQIVKSNNPRDAPGPVHDGISMMVLGKLLHVLERFGHGHVAGNRHDIAGHRGTDRYHPQSVLLRMRQPY